MSNTNQYYSAVWHVLVKEAKIIRGHRVNAFWTNLGLSSTSMSSKKERKYILCRSSWTSDMGTADKTEGACCNRKIFYYKLDSMFYLLRLLKTWDHHIFYSTNKIHLYFLTFKLREHLLNFLSITNWPGELLFS